MTRTAGPVFIALVNPKSGGNVGNALLARFKEILDEDRVYSLADGGPERALQEHRGTENLRIIGQQTRRETRKKAGESGNDKLRVKSNSMTFYFALTSLFLFTLK